MGIKMSPENSPVVCDGYVKYEEEKLIDKLSCKIIEIRKNEGWWYGRSKCNQNNSTLKYVMTIVKYDKMTCMRKQKFIDE